MAWHFQRTTFKQNFTRFCVTDNDFCNSAFLNKTFQFLVSCLYSYVRLNFCGFAWERHIKTIASLSQLCRLFWPISTIGLYTIVLNPIIDIGHWCPLSAAYTSYTVCSLTWTRWSLFGSAQDNLSMSYKVARLAPQLCCSIMTRRLQWKVFVGSNLFSYYFRIPINNRIV